MRLVAGFGITSTALGPATVELIRCFHLRCLPLQNLQYISHAHTFSLM